MRLLLKHTETLCAFKYRLKLSHVSVSSSNSSHSHVIILLGPAAGFGAKPKCWKPAQSISIQITARDHDFKKIDELGWPRDHITAQYHRYVPTRPNGPVDPPLLPC